MKMSKSKVLSYIQCPRRFMFQTINQIPCEMHPAALIGIKIHDMCNNFFDKVDINYSGDITEHFDCIKDEMLKGIECEKTILYFENFINMEIARFNEMTKDDRTLYYIPKLREMKYKAKEERITGIIDRVEYVPNIGYVLLDYKTGSAKNIKEYMFELSLYAWLVQKFTGIVIKKVGIIKLKNVRKVYTPEDWVTITDKDTMKALSITYQIRQLINKGEFPKNEAFHCTWCPPHYKILCGKIDERIKTGNTNGNTIQ